MLMSAMISLWGVRLTHNFARKGGYKRGEEDYRWAVLREKKKIWFDLFVRGEMHSRALYYKRF